MAGSNNIGVKTHFFNSGLKNITAGATEVVNFGGPNIYANSVTVWNNSDSVLEVEIESTLTSVGVQIVPPYMILVCSIVSDRFNELRIKQVGGTTGQFLVNSIRDNKDVSSNSGNRIETSLTAIGGEAAIIPPIINQIETTSYKAYYQSDCSKPMLVELIRNEDGTFDRYVAHLMDGTGTVIDPLLATDIGDCEKVETFEKCFPFTYTIQNGDTKTLADLMALAGVSGAIGVGGFDFDLKPIDGDGSAGFVASTSQATSNGTHGFRDLDGGGSFQIKSDRLPDGTINQLNLSQSFSTFSGSVATILIDIILP